MEERQASAEFWAWVEAAAVTMIAAARSERRRMVEDNAEAAELAKGERHPTLPHDCAPRMGHPTPEDGTPGSRIELRHS